jgi:hypothetical protein
MKTEWEKKKRYGDSTHSFLKPLSPAFWSWQDAALLS